MKSYVCLFVGVIVSIFAHGQKFMVKSSQPLSDTVSFHALEWTDADNDGLLDVIAFATNPAGTEKIYLFKGDSVAGLQFIYYYDTQMSKAVHVITDFDGDNSMDVVVSGEDHGQPVTRAFLGRTGTGFTFETTPVINASAAVIRFADLDQDGVREILFSGKNNGEPFLRILKEVAGAWTVFHDSIRIDASRIETFDFDDDNDIDFFVSGTDDNGMVVTRAYYNEKDFYFKAKRFSPAVSGVTTVADLNGDGRFDILAAGQGAAGDHTLAFINSGSGFSVRDTLAPVLNPAIFAADLNSDGICDLNLQGLQPSGDTLNMIFSKQGDENIAHSSLVAQAFGDYEHDGDLDLVQLTKTPAGYALRVMANTTPATNFSPDKPRMPIMARIFNRLFMYWDRPSDDRTPVPSLTYDVSIRSAGENLIVPQFDLINGRRLTASHGNNGPANYVLIRSPETGPLSFDIQSVDNSLHAGIGSVCKGSGGLGSGICADIETVNLEVCKNENVILTSGERAHWFSFRDGFLADTSVYAFNFNEPDTIFSVLTDDAGCARIRVYTLSKGRHITRKFETTDYVCAGQTLYPGVERGWSTVEWSSARRGFLSGADSIEYVVTIPDTITVKVSDSTECVVQRNTVLSISQPVIGSAHDAYQILKGESVALIVSGGVSYEWVPASGLSDPRSAAPVASPLKTTEYSVVVKDSIGCTATARILVVVEETAFIPNLFTPNNDGNNDILRIYGLSPVTGFSFTIYNREGNKVYHTTNISDAVNNGWNGTAGGMDQPSGVYYWSVNGETASGKKLQLNGRNSGSIVLVR